MITFTDIQGGSHTFDGYLAFATWYFGIPRRRMVMAFDADTFKKIENKATRSREARAPYKPN